MRYVILPIEDAQVVFTNDELSTMRKSIDEKEVIVHEEIIIRKRDQIGLTTLISEETGVIEWTYPVYEYNSNELNNLLSSEAWTNNEQYGK